MKIEKFDKEKGVITVNVSVLLGFIFVFQTNDISFLTKMSLTISLSLFIVSLLAFLWHFHRLPIRERLWKGSSKRLAQKYTDKMNAYAENIVKPLAQYKQREEIEEKLANAKSNSERQKIIQELKNEIVNLEIEREKLIRNPDYKYKDSSESVHSFFNDAVASLLVYEIKEEHTRSFNKPLKEKLSKVKFIIDILVSKGRYYMFTSACIFALVSLYVHLLS